MSEPDQSGVCSVCGLPLPGGELAARCPHCLINLALDDDGDTGASPERGQNPERVRPRFFGEFELIEQIAQGGMGVVWKARQLTVNRLVALKMIHAGHLASAEARVRFSAEIEATARLEHPHIVPLFETGEHEGVHYFTMKLLNGDLASRRADIGLAAPASVPPPARELHERQTRIARLMVKIARAVQYAHLRGILHRDLKPSNVLLDEAGEPHVGDFGLAKMLTRESGFTFTQSVLGSPNYMAPEQASGRTSELTTATDVYGLGAILYELLAGRPPFQAESPVATLRLVTEQPPVPLKKLNAGIESDLETICLKCLEKLPENRYASAEALAQDLERWLDKRPIQARRAGVLERSWRWCQREPALAAALALCFALLLSVAVVSTLAIFRVREAERKGVAPLRDLLVNQARSLRLTSEIGHRDEGLRLLREACQLGGPAEFQARARDELLATLVRMDLRFTNLSALRPARDPALNLASPDFARLASVTGSNTIVVQSVPDGRELARFSTGDEAPVRLEQFSHDGRFLGMRGLRGIEVWDTETGQRCFSTNGPQRVFCFAPDQPRLVVEEWNYQATVLELPSGRVIQQVRATSPTVRGPPQGWSAMAVSPNEQTLVVARSKDFIMEWIDLKTGEVTQSTTNNAAVLTLAWNRQGTRLAASLSNGRVPVFNANNRRIFVLPPMPGAARSLAFNPDGSLLAASCQDRALRLIDTEALRYAHESRSDASAITFDASGSRLGPVLRGGDLGWLDSLNSIGFHQVTVVNTSIELDGCHFSPAGRMMVVGNATNLVFWDTTEGRRLLSRPGWRFNACRFDPQSNFLFMASSAGVFRWNSFLEDTGRLNLTNMELVIKGRGWRAFAFNVDGSRFIAANVNSNAAYVFDRNFTNVLSTVGPHTGADFVALSPDGRWGATGSKVDRHIRVWDARNGESMLALPVGPDPRAAFSADGQWLATFGDTFALHKVGSWEPAPALPLPDNRPILGAADFSPDGRVLAVVCNEYMIQLIDLKTFRALGQLQSPGKGLLSAIGFSPDGRQVAGVGNVGRLQIWNLRQIRARLREFSLDRDWPDALGNMRN